MAAWDEPYGEPYAYAGPWTTERVLALGEDRGQRRERVGEALLLSPAPGIAHQRALSRLRRLLDDAVRRAGAPAEVSER
ncbi:hypothetical protein ABZ990_07075 [Streptomyces sp. NPDC046203]|uniref:hypothetical protein n=1 Tax=Streptomyces sp. NPDC046203 TaxID=3154602 RepID=UPI0033E85FBD